MREKLVELITVGFSKCAKPNEFYAQLDLEALADHLIAHGVTLATDNNVGDKKPLTNSDHKRAMTDEELAKEFSDTILCVPEGRCHGNPKTSCYECWLNWLKQPAKEET